MSDVRAFPTSGAGSGKRWIDLDEALAIKTLPLLAMGTKNYPTDKKWIVIYPQTKFRVHHSTG